MMSCEGQDCLTTNGHERASYPDYALKLGGWDFGHKKAPDEPALGKGWLESRVYSPRKFRISAACWVVLPLWSA